MLNTVQLERYASVLLWGLTTARTQRFKKNDIILIRCDLPATPLGEVVFKKLMEMGMNPVLRLGATPTVEKTFFALANDKQLTFKLPGDEELYNSLNGAVYLNAPASLTHLSSIDPKRIGKAAIARKYLRDILDKREEQGAFGWTLCMYPTEELAKHAGMDIKDYSTQIVKACLLNKADPVAEWKAIYRTVGEIKKWLNGLKAKSFHIESASVDLQITPGEKRKWIGISGHNIPSFEIFLSPDWRGTQGRYYADQPSYRSGNLVEGVRLEFKNGTAVKVDAATGAEFTRKQLAMDKGAGKVGEFSLTDKRFSKIDRFMANTLFDENFGGKYGNCHIAVGASYSDTYSGDPATLTREKKEKLGFNDSALHWDLVNTENKRVTATLTGGKRIVIYENGEFKM
ncbi:MAG TPA: aminopeptidase [Deltaproteobacteria bacterium]|nr:aminopeptidase [Deltaproteobacteria bacterium]